MTLTDQSIEGVKFVGAIVSLLTGTFVVFDRAPRGCQILSLEIERGGRGDNLIKVTAQYILDEDIVIENLNVTPLPRSILRPAPTPSGNIPGIERPEVYALGQPVADVAQPGNPGMGGFRGIMAQTPQAPI